MLISEIKKISYENFSNFSMVVWLKGEICTHIHFSVTFSNYDIFILQMSPMSILACLGNDAEPIRDMYLTRLQAVSEVFCLIP